MWGDTRIQYTEKVVIFGKCGNGIKPESLDVLATNTCWGSVVLRSRDGASPLPFSDCKKYDGISLFKLKIHSAKARQSRKSRLSAPQSLFCRRGFAVWNFSVVRPVGQFYLDFWRTCLVMDVNWHRTNSQHQRRTCHRPQSGQQHWSSNNLGFRIHQKIE